MIRTSIIYAMINICIEHVFSPLIRMMETHDLLRAGTKIKLLSVKLPDDGLVPEYYIDIIRYEQSDRRNKNAKKWGIGQWHYHDVEILYVDGDSGLIHIKYQNATCDLYFVNPVGASFFCSNLRKIKYTYDGISSVLIQKSVNTCIINTRSNITIIP